MQWRRRKRLASIKAPKPAKQQLSDIHWKILTCKTKHHPNNIITTRKLVKLNSIASRLNYCNCIWDKCSVEFRKKLQTIQNRSARRILIQLPGVSAAPLMHKLGWIALARKRKLHKLVLLHRLLLGNGPRKLRSKLLQYKRKPAKSTRGVQNNNLYINSFRTDYIKKSFFYDAIKQWNSLPIKLKDIKSNRNFKDRLQAYFLVGDLSNRSP